MNNYFRGTKDTPHHISVGAVLLDDIGKIGCHFYGPSVRSYPENVYMLMHETIEQNESLEQTLTRGLKEEFSAKADLIRYVGSIVSQYPNQGVSMEKTVLYFLCRMTSIDEKRDLNDPENVSEIRWMHLDNLIEIMKKQGKTHPDFDESKILWDVKNMYGRLR
jgi:NADH pyrophosphatase NudC (nudix superfamily)